MSTRMELCGPLINARLRHRLKGEERKLPRESWRKPEADIESRTTQTIEPRVGLNTLQLERVCWDRKFNHTFQSICVKIHYLEHICVRAHPWLKEWEIPSHWMRLIIPLEVICKPSHPLSCVFYHRNLPKWSFASVLSSLSLSLSHSLTLTVLERTKGLGMLEVILKTLQMITTTIIIIMRGFWRWKMR